MLTIQYLEDSPDLASLGPVVVGTLLKEAFDRLPIDCVILGWNLPGDLYQVCADETAHHNAQLFRWHPLLAGERDFVPHPEWRVIGLNGEPVPGFLGLPEFTFMCPNRPVAREAILNHLSQSLHDRHFDGVFLDRMRFPSPAANPLQVMACFCPDCHRLGAESGIDLAIVKRTLAAATASPEHARQCASLLLNPSAPVEADSEFAMLQAFLAFRVRSVTNFVQAASELARGLGLKVGLDCFAPWLTHLVGQDLKALDPYCDWIKVMTYGHTYGPAGMPFELLQLANWLMADCNSSEADSLACLSSATELLLPKTRAELQNDGLAPEALGREIQRGRAAGVRSLLAGVELVRVEGVTRLSETQIAADLTAIRAAGANGLSLSWDLRWMPVEWLDVVSQHLA